MTDSEPTLSVTPNLVERVAEFNRIGQIIAPGHFNADRVGFYTGMQCEELAETMKCIAKGCVTEREREHMAIFAQIMDAWGKDFKAGKFHGAILRCDREELLDGAIDVLVVSAGSLVYQTPLYREAIGEVLDANDRKFPDGIATHDDNGKIVKPEGWKKPNLSPFVDRPID